MSGDSSKPATFKFVMKEYGSAFAITDTLAAHNFTPSAALVSELTAAQQAWLARTPAERAAENERHAERQAEAERQREQERRERMAANRAAWQAVIDWAVAMYGLGSPVYAIAELHQPDDGAWYQRECTGCSAEVSGYEYDMEDWPCATFKLLQEAAQA